MAAAVIYVISNDPKAFAFEGVDLVQILYIVFDVTIKSKGQIIFHIINNWILLYKSIGKHKWFIYSIFDLIFISGKIIRLIALFRIIFI